jgi:hypothetical protein
MPRSISAPRREQRLAADAEAAVVGHQAVAVEVLLDVDGEPVQVVPVALVDDEAQLTDVDPVVVRVCRPCQGQSEAGAASPVPERDADELALPLAEDVDEHEARLVGDGDHRW